MTTLIKQRLDENNVIARNANQSNGDKNMFLLRHTYYAI